METGMNMTGQMQYKERFESDFSRKQLTAFSFVKYFSNLNSFPCVIFIKNLNIDTSIWQTFFVTINNRISIWAIFSSEIYVICCIVQSFVFKQVFKGTSLDLGQNLMKTLELVTLFTAASSEYMFCHVLVINKVLKYGFYTKRLYFYGYWNDVKTTFFSIYTFCML